MSPALKACRSALLLAAAICLAVPAAASAPAQKTQAPGYYRMMLGDFEITALSDGIFSMDVQKLLTHITPERLKADLARAFLKSPVDTSVNGFLVNTGSKLVLIDTGAGILFGPMTGKLRANLAAAGYEPGQVDEIYITHMHGDHVGGLVVDGKRAFPNAVVRAARQDADTWLSKERMAAAPKEARSSFQAAMDALNPYVTAGKFKPFDGAVELIPGVRAEPAPGHTPGHTAYVIESKGQKLLLWGDLMHVAAAQFPDPAVTIHFDSDSNQATASRQKIFAAAAAQGYLIGGAHLSFPGMGHLRASGTGYTYVPINYDAVH
ncbi:MAG TPA: MBL fold metallo-hydrolase [Steroidobacteraceae bacterium]|jgi:glyoxylase-like metal-dependent hydrolase (beta-lactamase superfamily II)|nr:MBL fold metallo-hydrolase [Steroidobacteraceae bacterium]